MKVTVIKSVNVETFDMDYPQCGVELAHTDGLLPAVISDVYDLPFNPDTRVERVRLVEFVDLKTRERQWVGFSASAKSNASLVFESFDGMNREIDRLRRIKPRNVSRPEFKLDLTEWYKLQKRLRNETR